MTKISSLDWEIIDARVKRHQKNKKLSTLSKGFLTLVLGQLFPSIEEDLPEVIVDNTDDYGIDAINIIEKETSAEIFLIQSKYREKHSTCSKTINDNEIIKVSHFINQVFDKSEFLLKDSNFKLIEWVKRIWDLNNQGKICRFKVIFCSNGNGLSQSAKKICEALEQSYSQVSFEFYSGHDAIQGMALEGRAEENGTLQVIGKEILERTDGDVRGVIASIDANSFIELITDKDGTSIKRHLFDDNLRVFLGKKGGFNSSIITTATSSDSYLFWYLNNGITITCNKYAYNKGQTNPSLRFENFQIVNGAQTSHSLIEAKRASNDNFNDVVLMVRIYATDRADIAERVAVATNSQARIQSRDLKSNHPTLVKLELALKERGYFFERKRNMYVNEPDHLKIDALKLGQILLSYDLREPERAKTDSDSIFDNRFNSIFNEDKDVDKLLRLIKLYNIIDRRRDSFLQNSTIALEGKGENSYFVYGHWFILYACRLLLAKNKSLTIPMDDDAESLVTDAVRLVSEAFKDQKSIAHYQIFRSSRSKDKLTAEISAKQLDFFTSLMLH